MQSLEIGQRIRLIEMPDDPDPIPPGSEGTIMGVRDLCTPTDGYYSRYREAQIDVDWDSGRTLMLIYPKDRFEIIS